MTAKGFADWGGKGGPNTGDHVDILGRSSLNDLILRVAGGKGEHIEDCYASKIREYAEKVQVFEEEPVTQI